MKIFKIQAFDDRDQIWIEKEDVFQTLLAPAKFAAQDLSEKKGFRTRVVEYQVITH